jgi:hypothetical protein
MMPFALFLLQFFLDCLFFAPHALMLFEEPVDRCFQLFDIMESHGCVHHPNFMFEFSFNLTPCQAKLNVGSNAKAARIATQRLPISHS